MAESSGFLRALGSFGMGIRCAGQPSGASLAAHEAEPCRCGRFRGTGTPGAGGVEPDPSCCDQVVHATRGNPCRRRSRPTHVSRGCAPPFARISAVFGFVWHARGASGPCVRTHSPRGRLRGDIADLRTGIQATATPGMRCQPSLNHDPLPCVPMVHAIVGFCASTPHDVGGPRPGGSAMLPEVVGRKQVGA